MALSKEWKAGLISGGVGLGVLIAVIWYMKNDTAAKEKDVAASSKQQADQEAKSNQILSELNRESLREETASKKFFNPSGGKRRTKRRSNKSRIYKKGSQKK